MTRELEFQVNGESVSFGGSPLKRLLDVLRQDLHLIGTKEGCGEGECGSCSVLLDGQPVCSCLIPIFQVEGASVTTVEGLAPRGEPSPLQKAFVQEGGVQCGACTPGILVSAQALLSSGEELSRVLVRDRLCGNLCRCTGYVRVVDAVIAASQMDAPHGRMS